jgi:hypothetical protein
MTLKETKRKYENSWLQIPGVVSVGIGMNKKGERVIRIGMSLSSDTWPEEIPKTVEGYPVETYYSGKINARG